MSLIQINDDDDDSIVLLMNSLLVRAFVVSVLNADLALKTPCSSNPCMNRGQCIDNPSSSKGEPTYECRCRSGYKGNNCEHGNALADVNFYHYVLFGPFVYLFIY